MKVTKSLLVSVTQEDIEKGSPNVTTECAVARAIQRADNGREWWVETSGAWPQETFSPDDPASWRRIDERPFPVPALEMIALDQNTADQIAAFDAGRPITPFTFVLVWNAGA